MIPFKDIPQDLRIPLFHAEVDNSHANSAQQVERALIIGQITANGAAVADQPVISQGISDAINQGGQGSMLALMTAMYRLNDTFGELWYLPVADDPTATAATGGIDITSPPTIAGTLYLYIAYTTGASKYLPQRITLPVLPTQTTAQIATALAAAINATPNLPVSAAVDATTTTKVDITALNKGEAGNDIDIRLNYLGSAGGEAMPIGMAVTITAMSAGAVNPSLSTGLANLGSEPYDFIVCPYTDATSLQALETFLNDSTGRWSWETQVYGHVLTAYRGTVGTQTTFGTGLNDQHKSAMGFNDSPTPNWLWAAGLAGATAPSVRADPALPLQTVQIQGVAAPPIASRFDAPERNTLLFDGISTFTVASDGSVHIENLITTYQKNAFGDPDNSYLEANTMFNLTYILRALSTTITSKYSRVKLAAYGTRFAPGSAVVTPNIIRADLIATYLNLEFGGFVQNGAAFKAGLIVEQNATNPNRVDVLWPGELIDQLRIFALLAQFRLH